MRYPFLALLLIFGLSVSAQTTPKPKPKAPAQKKVVKVAQEETPPPYVEPIILPERASRRKIESGEELVISPEPISTDTVTYSGSAEGLDSVARFYGSDFGMVKSNRLSYFIRAVASKDIGDVCGYESRYFVITVDAKGNVIEARSLKPDANSECVKVVIDAIFTSSGRWSPAVKKGQKVKNRFTFKL